MACRGKPPAWLTEPSKEHFQCPKDQDSDSARWHWQRSALRQRVVLTVLAAATVYGLSLAVLQPPAAVKQRTQEPSIAADILHKCASRFAVPGHPDDLMLRHTSDRFERGTRATLIKNVTLWTGARNGTEIVYGDIFLDKGLVQGIGYIPELLYADRDTDVVDAHGGWVTPGLGERCSSSHIPSYSCYECTVDLHSRVGLVSSPITAGALELDSPNGPILPWLRSIDGLNTHDAAYAYAIAGGVTTVQVLPDSGHNAIGASPERA